MAYLRTLKYQIKNSNQLVVVVVLINSTMRGLLVAAKILYLNLCLFGVNSQVDFHEDALDLCERAAWALIFFFALLGQGIFTKI
jgi:hypothetical protein